MDITAALLLALAVSLDGLVVGLTYGIKGIKLNLLPGLIISLASGIMIFAAMSLGQLLTVFLTPAGAAKIGGLILIGIGIWLFYQSLHNLIVEEETDYRLYPRELVSFKIPRLGLIINILKEPVTADLDYSGVISKQEAFFLGIALAMDAFGAGIGAALLGYQAILTAVLVVIAKFSFLSLGITFGREVLQEKIAGKLKLVPGLILILLGIFQLF